MAFRFPDAVYPIIDSGNRSGQSLIDLGEAVLAGGARLIQLRVKGAPTRTFVETARAVKRLTDRYAAALIVNDRADITKLVGAAGVHLGQEDLHPTEVRKWLGPGAIIGVSTHNLRQVRETVETGTADYLGFGPIFPTSNKSNPDPIQGLRGLRRVREHCPLPLVAIGGIGKQTVEDVLAAGADAVAVIGAIAQQEDPREATRELLERALAAMSGVRNADCG